MITMLIQAYDILVGQLQKNMEKQDFYKNICTEVQVKGWHLQLLHPWFIKDVLTGDDVFPDKAQTDIDKEFEPSLALYLAFSMKEDKQQLERFREMDEFGKFKEIKDFGSRMYAIDFGTDTQAAAEMCMTIAENVYEAKTARSIHITTTDLESGTQIGKRTIRAPKKEPEPVKVDGIAMRVVEETNDGAPGTEDSPASLEVENSETTQHDVSDTTYKTAMWLLGFLIALVLFVVITKNNEKDVAAYIDSEEATMDVDTATETIASTQEKTETEIIGRWIETESGSAPGANYGWTLEHNKSNGTYRLIQTLSGTAFLEELQAIPKKVKRSNEYVCHDVRNEQTFTLKAGESIYFIPNFDGNANAILIMRGKTGYLYANDINSRQYDYFATLQPIN